MIDEILSIISGVATLVLLSVAVSLLVENGLNLWSLVAVGVIVAVILLVRTLLGRR